jgi:hypothetical protein
MLTEAANTNVVVSHVLFDYFNTGLGGRGSACALFLHLNSDDGSEEKLEASQHATSAAHLYHPRPEERVSLHFTRVCGSNQGHFKSFD